MISKQKTFDTVARHLLTQGQPARYAGACWYRTETGLRCAVGCLIPDSEYTSAMEWGDAHRARKLSATLRTHSVELLMALQSIHDCAPPESWRQELRALAEKEGLSTLVLDTYVTTVVCADSCGACVSTFEGVK